MAKNISKKHVEPADGPKNVNFKKRDKFAAKLKNKLKSAIFNQKSAATEILIGNDKKLKSNAKLYTNLSASTSTGFKQTPKSTVTNQNNVGKSAKLSHPNAGPVKVNGKQAEKQVNSSTKPSKYQEMKNGSKTLNSKSKNSSVKPNGVIDGEHQRKKNKKKNKKKKKKSVPSNQNPSENQPNPSNSKRKVEEVKINQDTGKKRLKTIGGFVETNADNEEETKLVKEQLKEAKKKKLQKKKSQDSADVEAGPPVKVHTVGENQINGSGSNSDSEADSYIDRFFGDGKGDFDENHIYSLDEIEAENRNGFLAKASGNVTKSDESSFSDDGTNDNSQSDIDSECSAISIASSNGSNQSSPKDKLVGYKKAGGKIDYDFDDFSWSDVIDGEQSLSDNSDMYYGTDSDVSLGSAIDSDDLDDTYEEESSDMESLDDMSSDDHEEFSSGSECSHSYSDDSQSASSRDTYDEFCSRRYDDEHSSNDDHEYKSKF